MFSFSQFSKFFYFYFLFLLLKHPVSWAKQELLFLASTLPYNFPVISFYIFMNTDFPGLNLSSVITKCVTLGKLLSFSVPQFPYM